MSGRLIQPDGQQAPPPAIRVEGLRKTIDDCCILDDLTFAVPQGQFTVLLGANGAGKSTLLRIISTLVSKSAGEFELFGTPIRANHATQLRSRIGMIGHDLMLYRDLTARENLVLFGRLYNLPNPRERADELLDWVELSHRANDVVHTFSRGMSQRVSIAGSLMHNPDLLRADEPFSGLDAPSHDLLERMMVRLHQEGRTIILSSHDIPRSLDLTEHALVLRRGRLIINEPADRLDASTLLTELAAA